MMFDRDEIFKLGIQAKIKDLERQIDELRKLKRTDTHPTKAKVATDAPPKKKAKRKPTAAQLDNLRKAWAARRAQAKQERAAKEKEE